MELKDLASSNRTFMELKSVYAEQSDSTQQF